MINALETILLSTFLSLILPLVFIYILHTNRRLHGPLRNNIAVRAQRIYNWLKTQLTKFIFITTFRNRRAYYARMTGRGSSSRPISNPLNLARLVYNSIFKGPRANDETAGVKMFEFSRIRCMRRAARSMVLPSSLAMGHEFGVPKKRSGHRAVCNEENLWIWGGYCPVEEMSEDEWDMEDGNLDNSEEGNPQRSPLFPQLWRFNFATKIWKLLKTTGDEPTKTVASHSALLYGNNTLLVWGGTGFPFGEELTNSLYTCNLNTLVWKKFDLKGDIPLGLYGSSIVFVDDCLYCLFGTNAREYCSNVYRINMKTLEVETLFDSISLIENANFFEMEQLSQLYPNEFLFGRYRQEVVYHDDKLLTFGGGKIDGDAYGFDQLPVFNLKTLKWEFVSTLPDLNSKVYPQQRKFHSCILIDKFVYMFGGMYCDVARNVFTVVDNFVWRLDLNEMRWQRLAIKMPCLTYFHAACANKSGEVFFHGGVKTISREQTCRINHLYKIVLKIPPLAELSWSKLISSYPRLVFVDKQRLFEIGVPTNFINRVN